MASVPTQASVVVVGAGIVGNSLVHHLAELGWKDIVQVDKGPLPNPGGSTGHASNFIFPVDHSREITDLTLDSMRQYKELGVFTESGGFEVARTEERMQELARRMASARAWGIESQLVTPAEIAEKVPFLDPEVIVGGFWTPTYWVVNSVRAGTMMRDSAEAKGALTVSPNTEVTGIDVEDGRIVRVHTTKGEIATDRILVACGVWSPRIAAMAGASIPLSPAVHQMISVGPVPARSRFRSCAIWTRSATNASTVRTWRSAPTPTGPSSTNPTTSPRTNPRSCRRRRCHSPMRTSTRSSNRPSNSCPRSCRIPRSRSAMRSTGCCR